MDTPSEYAKNMALIETVKKVDGRWALVSRKSEKVLAYYNGEGEPSDDWIRKQERRIQYFSEVGSAGGSVGGSAGCSEVGSEVDSEVGLDEASTAFMPHVFCDIDGVIANFYAGMKRFFNIPPDKVDAFLRLEGRWKEIAKKEPHLFAKLPLLPDAEQLMSGLDIFRKRKLIRLSMLTAIPDVWYADPVLRRAATADKITWVTRHFPQIPAANVLVVRRKDKASYAKAQVAAGQPQPILIDDFGMNIQEWEAAGGFGIKHTRAADSVYALRLRVAIPPDAFSNK